MPNRTALLLSAVVGLLAGAFGGVLAVRMSAPAGTDMAAVREHIIANPDIVRDAILELQRREEQAEARSRQDLIAEHAEEIFRSPRDYVAGNPDGDITIVEFFDYNCVYCRRALDDMNRLLETDPQLRFVLKEFPILGPGSVDAARLAIAAQKQGRYLDYHRAMLAAEGRLDGGRALDIAGEIGLDVERLKADAAAPEIDETIRGVHALASLLGVNGTPGYVIADEIIPGALGFEVLAEKIAEARQRARAGD